MTESSARRTQARQPTASPCAPRGSFDRPGDELCRAARNACTSCVLLSRCCRNLALPCFRDRDTPDERVLSVPRDRPAVGRIILIERQVSVSPVKEESFVVRRGFCDRAHRKKMYRATSEARSVEKIGRIYRDRTSSSVGLH